MHIEEVIIDGFKSYRHRTVVSGFHTHFNAITGLNGSGKSNILDAICFVLGITNLKHVRAQNLQDLVYKKGHGGVTKASVTIVFDNKDKETSPANYEAFDQITVTRQIQIGGTNKYLINGRNVDKKRLNALFLSVQLNVNNPHFLIMQGRVTKVLNMKPPEILSLIEEAAGTKLFEISKKESFSMIEKKDKKLNEIDSVLDEEVEPKMQQLKKERSAYLEFQKNQQEIDIRSRYVTAYHYCCNKSKYDAMSAEFVVVEKVMLDFNKRKSELVLQLKDTEQNLEILRKKKEAEIGGGLRDLDKEVQSISKKLVTETASVANATDTLNSETLAVAQFEESEKEALEAIEAKKKELEKAMNDLGPIEQAHITAAEGMEKAKRDLQAVRAGMSTGESDNASSFDDTIRQAENEQAAAESERQTRQMKVKHATAELKTKKPQAVQAEKTHGSATRQLKEKHSQLELMRTQLQVLPFDKDAYDTLNNERKVLADRVRQLENTFESLKSENRGFTFNYSDPEPNFDRTKVHGLVARLIQIANENVTGALEVAAGGRLYNVVIDSQETGAKLLKRGRLRHRVTFIPLNRIAARTITPQQLQRAKQLVGVENAELALTLVGYPKDIEKAMQYVFGTTIVCTSAQAAQKVTYDRDVRTRCVTLDGDVYEPSGTLSGGSNRNKSSVLQRLQKLNQAEEEFTQAARELADLDAKLEMCTQQKTHYSETAAALKNLQYQYDLLDKTIRSSPHGALIQEVADLEKAIADHTEAIQHATHQLKTAAARIEEVEKERKAFVNSRESQTEKMEKLLALQRKASQKATQKFKAHKEVIDGLELELQQMSNDHEGFDAQKADLKASVEKAKANLTARQQKLLQIEADYDSANERLQKKREKLDETDAEMKKMAATKAKVEKEQGDLEIENKTAMHRKSRMQSELKDQADSVKHLLLSNVWITKEEHLFGNPGTTYDFQNGQDPHESEVELQRLKAMQEGLKGQVNMEFGPDVPPFTRVFVFEAEMRKGDVTNVSLDIHAPLRAQLEG
ncbi:hypothetical protein SARC_03322 [Sphaeroforma arctica JP610]|uniref:SMC hinge domain-containing protein n=1 Tax=Sphaeroforma arctica JP610 TaxID=667725 RepID=A0A0L0G883_9EUKA|nr:hypothetical protein SARC_03322 [Sphaeroforma arctica JP610]KNC84458.1 hypothetical protein SARC_03322 [Sphaeroforma arctica JP610]|eukprot:XP_014158360.1 hypothetical protein SARC_03322 [Sphaeroforma arctica JP610]